VNAVRLQALHRAPIQQSTMSVVKLEGGHAASVKPGQKSCVRSSRIITLLARRPSNGLGRSPPQTSHNDQSHRGHPLEIEPGSLRTGGKLVVHWTSETCECSEIAGSPHCSAFKVVPLQFNATATTTLFDLEIINFKTLPVGS
jgi:hypothetical protein